MNHYEFKNYCSAERWASYYRQLDEILKMKPASVLEIGVGDGVLGNYLKKNTEIKYTGMDSNRELAPDILGSIEKIPLPDAAFDLVCAFEVLEHLPYEKFASCLQELRRVAINHVIISLPHWGRHFSFDLRLPFIKRLKGMLKLNLCPARHEFNGQHHWEIGKQDYPIGRIREAIRAARLELIDDYVVFESPYHHFFITRKC
jgi:hypothetical protein